MNVKQFESYLMLGQSVTAMLMLITYYLVVRPLEFGGGHREQGSWYSAEAQVCQNKWHNANHEYGEMGKPLCFWNNDRS